MNHAKLSARMIVAEADEAAFAAFLECLNVRKKYSFSAMLAAASDARHGVTLEYPQDLQAWANTYRLNSDEQIRQALALIECGYAEELAGNCRVCAGEATAGVLCEDCAADLAQRMIDEITASMVYQCIDCGEPSQQAVCEGCIEERRR